MTTTTPDPHPDEPGPEASTDEVLRWVGRRMGDLAGIVVDERTGRRTTNRLAVIVCIAIVVGCGSSDSNTTTPRTQAPPADAPLLDQSGDLTVNDASDARGRYDRFFTDVLVMAEDPDLRANRLGLLQRIRDLPRRSFEVAQVPLPRS